MTKELIHRDCAVRAIIDADTAFGAVLRAIELRDILDVITSVRTVVGTNAACGAGIGIDYRYAHGDSFLISDNTIA